MNLSACLLLATSLVAAGIAAPVHRWSASSSVVSVTSRQAVSFLPDFGPGLRGGLPPAYFCGESVPVHEEAVARRLVSALVRNTGQNKALYRGGP